MEAGWNPTAESGFLGDLNFNFQFTLIEGGWNPTAEEALKRDKSVTERWSNPESLETRANPEFIHSRTLNKAMYMRQDVVKPLRRCVGGFVLFCKGGAPATKNLVPGKAYSNGVTRYNGKILYVQNDDGTVVEYRAWNPYRSILLAAICCQIENIWIKSDDQVLYLGDGAGALGSVSHVSDMVGPNGMVYEVESCLKKVEEVVNMAAMRANVVPILQDARHPEVYTTIIKRMVDIIICECDTDGDDLVEILARNARFYLKPGGIFLLAYKDDYDTTPNGLFYQFGKKLTKDGFDPVEKVYIGHFIPDHSLIWGHYKRAREIKPTADSGSVDSTSQKRVMEGRGNPTADLGFVITFKKANTGIEGGSNPSPELLETRANSESMDLRTPNKDTYLKQYTVKPFRRHEGVFFLISENVIATENLIPGKAHSNGVNGRILYVQREDETVVEYRVLDPYRSTLGAAICRIARSIWMKPGERVLYLGDGAGALATVSHVSDIVGPNGMVYEVESCVEKIAEVVNMAAMRANVIPILEDARHPEAYAAVINTAVDAIYCECDVARNDLVEILTRNVRFYLKPGGHFLLTFKGKTHTEVELLSERLRSMLEEFEELTALECCFLHRYIPYHALMFGGYKLKKHYNHAEPEDDSPPDSPTQEQMDVIWYL